ncbi:hypothetical protein GGF46_000914 [Coemansia sp. RSA 552]|nr:hypothetical protein GGF46_000914 [Coemansia sp. RSA 552]
MRLIPLLSTALLAATVNGLPEPGLGVMQLIGTVGDIVAQDTQAGCLSPAAEKLDKDSRRALSKEAARLGSSLFRDTRQYAPVVVALGLTDVEKSLPGPNIESEHKALLSLQSYMSSTFASELAGESTTSAKCKGTDDCCAPTAINLRIIKAELDKIVADLGPN